MPARARPFEPAVERQRVDTYAYDLAALIELDLEGAALLGFSTGGGEIARYRGRHGSLRVTKAGLIAAVPPLMMLKTARIWAAWTRRVRRLAHGIDHRRFAHAPQSLERVMGTAPATQLIDE